jgi:hypothetical protein
MLSSSETQLRFFESPDFFDSSPKHVIDDLWKMNDEYDPTETNENSKRLREEIAGSESEDDGDSPDLKKQKRVLANRRSARESYQRRKKLFSELESAVSTLSTNNSDLVKENSKLRQQVMDLHEQLRLSRLSDAQMQCGIGASGMGPSSLGWQQLAGQEHSVASVSPAFLQVGTIQRQQLRQLEQPLQRQHQQHSTQQQTELDHLLELILSGRHFPA